MLELKLNHVFDYSEKEGFNKPVELCCRINKDPSVYFDFVFQNKHFVEVKTNGDISSVKPEIYRLDDFVLTECEIESRLEVSNIKIKEKLNDVMKDVLLYGWHKEVADWRRLADKGLKVFKSKEQVDKYFKSLGFDEVEEFSCHTRCLFNDDGSFELDEKISVFLPKGIKIGTMYFSPALRFNTVNRTARQQYAFVYKDPVNKRCEIVAESTFLCVLDKPELIATIK